MQKLYGCTVSIDEDEDITHAHIISHQVLNHTTERVHPFSHVCLPRTQEVAHIIIQAEHGVSRFDSVN